METEIRDYLTTLVIAYGRARSERCYVSLAEPRLTLSARRVLVRVMWEEFKRALYFI